MLFLLYERLNTEGHESFIWILYAHSLFFSYCFPKQCFDICEPMAKEGSLLGATAFAAVPTRGGHLIPYGPPTVSCKHG